MMLATKRDENQLSCTIMRVSNGYSVNFLTGRKFSFKSIFDGDHDVEGQKTDCAVFTTFVDLQEFLVNYFSAETEDLINRSEKP
jgi:hypothetical protein